MNDGRIGLSVLNTAVGKIRPDMVTLFFKGILCNVLVCAAVWLAYAGRSVTDKMVAVILPVSAFIAAGFEHCVANMYFLPLAWLLVQTGHVSGEFRHLAHHDVAASSTTSCRSRSATSSEVPALSAPSTGRSIGSRSARSPQISNTALSGLGRFRRRIQRGLRPVPSRSDTRASMPNSSATCVRRFATSPDIPALADSTS